jgi:hypothetical protein
MKDYLVKGDHSIVEIHEHLAIADIQAAADVLKPVVDETDVRDGYVRLDCTPYLANDTEAKDHQPPRSLQRTSGRLAKDVRAVDAADADWIRADVMDGRFSDAAAQETP